ncbi:proline-rich protein 2-like [Haemorhous mexicanus]|uniref:proline-rich protein 2-like n=1 Tax=Haemorhous mexicanus TaxID=30427 RepID=UPI0028BE5F85|nr:proline-rich protein 2-like [Haemorhous mexicanus]
MIPAVDTGTARAPGPERPDTRGSQRWTLGRPDTGGSRRWTSGNHSDEHWSTDRPRAHYGEDGPGPPQRRSSKGPETPPGTPLQRPPPHTLRGGAIRVRGPHRTLRSRDHPPPTSHHGKHKRRGSGPLPVTGSGWI